MFARLVVRLRMIASAIVATSKQCMLCDMCPVCKRVGSWADTKLKSQYWIEAHMDAGIYTYIKDGKVMHPFVKAKKND